MSRSSNQTGMAFVSRPEQGAGTEGNARAATVINETFKASEAIEVGETVIISHLNDEAAADFSGYFVKPCDDPLSGCGVYQGEGGTGAFIDSATLFSGQAAAAGDDVIIQRAGPCRARTEDTITAGAGIVSTVNGTLVDAELTERAEAIALDAQTTNGTVDSTPVMLMYV